MAVSLHNFGQFRCRITRRTWFWRLEVLKVYCSRDISVYVICHVCIITSGPSLLIESTDSMMRNTGCWCQWHWNWSSDKPNSAQKKLTILSRRSGSNAWHNLYLTTIMVTRTNLRLLQRPMEIFFVLYGSRIHDWKRSLLVHGLRRSTPYMHSLLHYVNFVFSWLLTPSKGLSSRRKAAREHVTGSTCDINGKVQNDAQNILNITSIQHRAI